MLAIATACPTSFVANSARASPITMQLSGTEYAKSLPAAGPFGFFDPFGLTATEVGSQPITPGKIRYYREVEVKHGRVAMLGAVGFLVGEAFHPLFGGDINVPSYIAFQATPLQDFWPAVVASIGVLEFFSIATIDGGFEVRETFPDGSKREAGDFFFDPLGLKPKDPTEFAAMQAKEINNGRLAMIAMAGMVTQEVVTGSKLF